VPALDAERASFSTRVRLRGSCNDRQGRVPSRPSEAVASNSLLMLCPARCKTGFAMTDRRCHGARLCPAVTQPASDSVIPRLLACLEPAANLVLQRSDELDGDHYEVLTPAADALSGTHPLAATLALRAMIDFSLKNNRSSRYRYAARHLIECSSLASAIEDFGRFEPLDAYEARLRREHPRKSSFWSLVD